MQTMPSDALLQNLSWRYAVKKFDPTRKIPARDWAALEQSLVLSPSSYGLQPWHFVVVTNPKIRATLKGVSWNQTQITDASHLVVLCRRTTMVRADVDRYVARIAAVRGVPAASLEPYRGMMLGSVEKPGADHSAWNARQVYIALGFFLSAAAVLGIDACPMEGFDAAQYDQILGLTARGFAATVVATAGYRAADDAYAALKKVRFPDSEVITRM